MPDNINITVNETIENIVINPSISTDIIDVNTYSTTENVTIDVTPNLTTVNINTITGSLITKTSDLINDGEDGVHPFITLEDIPAVTGFVPYTGATQDVNLGEFDITAAHLIKDGGQATQFLKADGSVDNNIYLTSADLPSTLDLYATTTSSDVSGYTVLVRNISDSRFNTTAVDVSTGVITTTSQLVGQLVSDANIISGNPGIFNITTIGNISRTSGTGQAEFFFRVYKRDNLGVETFITESSKTLPVINGGYVEFSAVALWNDGIFTDTDRVVLKYYADRLTSPVGSNPVYKFQFGGISPVRSTAAIPVAVLPNIYLRDLADVENVDALNNEVLYWNDADSLWEHSLVIDLLSPASSTVNGYLTSTDWTAFNGKFNLPSLTSGSVLFSNGTTIAQDNSNFFWDDTNNRLGIGTNVPTVGLETKGGFNLYTALGNHYLTSTSVSGTDSTLKFTRGAENGWLRFQLGGLQIAADNTGGECKISASAGGFYQTFFTANVERIRINAAGNTLINTTTDQGGKLQIKAPGALSTDIALRVRNSADSGDLMSVTGSGSVNFNSSSSLSNIAFFSNGENRIRFYSSAQTTDNLQIYTNGGAYGSSYGEIGYLFKNTATQMASINFDTRTSVAPFRFFVNPTGASAIDAMDIFRTGEVGIGTSNTNRGGKLQIKAPGALSTDIALRVRNSADSANLLDFAGNGILFVNTIQGFSGGRLDIKYGFGTSTPSTNILSVGYNGEPAIIIGTGTTQNSSMIQMNSTTQGFLPPRMTNAERLAIATPAVGLCVYCTDAVEGLYINKSTGWTYIG